MNDEKYLTHSAITRRFRGLSATLPEVDSKTGGRITG